MWFICLVIVFMRLQLRLSAHGTPSVFDSATVKCAYSKRLTDKVHSERHQDKDVQLM